MKYLGDLAPEAELNRMVVNGAGNPLYYILNFKGLYRKKGFVPGSIPLKTNKVKATILKVYIHIKHYVSFILPNLRQVLEISFFESVL